MYDGESINAQVIFKEVAALVLIVDAQVCVYFTACARFLRAMHTLLLLFVLFLFLFLLFLFLLMLLLSSSLFLSTRRRNLVRGHTRRSVRND